MSRLVVSDEPPLLVGQDPTAALQAEHHLILRILEIPHVDDGLVAAGGEQRSLVHDVRKLRAGRPRPRPPWRAASSPFPAGRRAGRPLAAARPAAGTSGDPSGSR